MPVDTQFPELERTPWGRLILTPIVAAAVLMAVWLLRQKWMPVLVPPAPKGVVLHQTANGWQRLPAPAGDPWSVKVSRGGAVWVQSWPAAGLSRLESGAWRDYAGADFGAQTGYLSGGFVLDGEELWAAAEEGVLHWNGQRWRFYREAVASRKAASIAAGGGQVWVIDLQGNLSHFEGGRWTIHKVELEGEKWGNEPELKQPGLSRTADGALWLVRSGVWRFDGANWVAVAPGGRKVEGAMLFGRTMDRVWLWERAGLRSISLDGSTETAYTRAQIGLAERERFSSAVSAGGRTWFATSKGILEFDGAAWRHLAPPRNGVEAIESLGLGPDGALWAIGKPPDPLERRRFWVLLGVYSALLIGFLGVLLWISKRFNRWRFEEHQRMRQAVEHATGEVPRELERAEQRLARESSWRGGLDLVGVLVGALAGYTFVRRVWPAAGAWTFFAILLGLHLAVTFARSLTRRTPEPSDPIGPGGPPRYDWGQTWKTLAGAVGFFLLINPHWLPPFVKHPGVCFLGVAAAIMLYNWLSARLMERAVRRCNFDGALKLIRGLHFYHPEGAGALRMRGYVLMLAGRYREAEDTLRRAIARFREGFEQAAALECLGDALMEQGRYDDAMRSYEAALHAAPGFRVPYRRMAELLLRQGKDTELALEYAERINDRVGMSWRDQHLSRRIQDDYWAVKAWALARLGRSAEVAPAIANAMKATNKKSPLDLAGTHYRAGMAMLALGQEAAAKEHFKRAVEYDPLGWRGALAKAELRGRSAWGSVKA